MKHGWFIIYQIHMCSWGTVLICWLEFNNSRPFFKSKWCSKESLGHDNTSRTFVTYIPEILRKKGNAHSLPNSCSPHFCCKCTPTIGISININKHWLTKIFRQVSSVFLLPPVPPTSSTTGESPEATPTDVAIPMAAETMPRCSGAAKSPPEATQLGDA